MIEHDSRARLASSVRAVAGALKLVYQADRRSAIVIAVVQLLGSIAVSVQLFALRELLARLDDGRSFDELGLPLAALLGAGLVLTLSATVLTEVRLVANERVVRSAMTSVVSAANDSAIADFEDDRFHDALNRAMRNTNSRIWTAVWASITLATSLIGVVALAVVLLLIAPWVLGVAILGALVPLFVARRNSRALFSVNYAFTPEDRQRGMLQGLLVRQASVPEIRAYGAQRHILERINALFDLRIRRVAEVARKRLTRNLAATTVSYVFGFLAIVFLVRQMASGELTLADGAVALVALQQVSGRLRTAASTLADLDEAALYLRDYYEFLDLAAVRAAEMPGDRLAPARVTATDVSFSYPGSSEDVLRGVSLSVSPGQVVAVVGENGSGKSTMAKLLAGLYEPREGVIQWGDDAPVAPADLRASTALMFQNFQRYPLTLAENVRFGDVDRADPQGEELASALSDSGVEELAASLNRGLDSTLSREFEDGVQLSGGQWQRVAVARAFYRDSPMLILDEPSAALDPRREAELFQSLRGLFAHRAVVFVSHRMAPVRTADRIYVMHEGEVVESGTHDELTELDGRYAEMCRLQEITTV